MKGEGASTPSPLVGEGRGEGATVSIRVKKPHTRRWRAGMCFTQEPRVESVTDEVLGRLQADPLLVIEEALPHPSLPSTIEGEGANSPSPSRGGVGEGADSGEAVNPDESANTPAQATEG
jgi:hypothetical protein